MANPEHVEILKQGVEVWNRWREENPDINPDFIDTDLSGANLNGANLASAVLTEANLTRADLRRANLTSAVLTEANLSSVNFTDADLSGASLDATNLSVANLSAAKLSGAKFTQAELTGAELIGADLTGADLTQANLIRVSLYKANLVGTNFDRSTMAYTTLTDLDFRSTIGLQSVEHICPSSIGIDTIYKSKGQIPEVFLRGCGVPESFISYMKSLTINPIDFYSCFISYSHQDKPFARRLHDQLQARGIRCWLDEKQLLPGDDIYDQVDRGIRMWDKVLLCCSQHSLTSWWVDNEVATAFNKEQKLMKDRKKKVRSLIPLNLDGFMFTDEWTSGKKQQIKERLAADFTGWETDNSKFESQFERVVLALKTEGAREEAPVGRL